MSTNQSHDEAFIEQLCQTINDYQLREVALFLLDLGRPLTFLGGQLLWIAQPALRPFVPSQQVEKLAQILETPAAVDQLSNQLTQSSAKRQAGS